VSRPWNHNRSCGACGARAPRSGTLAAKDEGHGFRKNANEDVYLETVAMFLNKLKVSKIAAAGSTLLAAALFTEARIGPALGGEGGSLLAENSQQ